MKRQAARIRIKLLLGVATVSLAACGGSGKSVTSAPPPVSNGGTTGSTPPPTPAPAPAPTPTPTPTPAPAPPPSGGGGGGGGGAPAPAPAPPAPAPAPEPILEVPPVWVPPTPENPITIQEDNETVTEQPRSNPIKKVGKKTVVTLEFDSSDYTSIRTYKWLSKKKRWKEVRYTSNFDDGIQMSFKKKGKYRVVGVNVLDSTRDVLVTFKVKKK